MSKNGVCLTSLWVCLGLFGQRTVRQLPDGRFGENIRLRNCQVTSGTKGAVKFSHACKLFKIVPLLARLKCMAYTPLPVLCDQTLVGHIFLVGWLVDGDDLACRSNHCLINTAPHSTMYCLLINTDFHRFLPTQSQSSGLATCVSLREPFI